MYNGGHFFWDIQTIGELDWLLARLGNHHPAVVLLYWEQFELSRSQLDGLRWRTDAIGEKLLGTGRYHFLRTGLQQGKREIGAWWNISPLEVLSIRLFKAISNDRFLPNPIAIRSTKPIFRSGQRILFLDEEVAPESPLLPGRR